jgi:hypothetical protein
VRKKGIPEEDGGMGTVGLVRGVRPMSGVGTVEHVVMDERGKVDEFDDGGAADQGERRCSAGTRGEGKEGAQSFAGVGQDFSDHGSDLGFEGRFLLSEESLQRQKVGVETGMERSGHPGNLPRWPFRGKRRMALD